MSLTHVAPRLRALEGASVLAPIDVHFALTLGEIVEEAERRDPKGLYRKAREGRLKHFTGIDSPYEPPEAPEIHIRTLDQTPEEAVELVIATLRRRGKLTSSYPAAS